jgi:hypothetical protein
MPCKRSNPPDRVKVCIWVEGKGNVVTVMSPGETGLTYHISIQTHKGRPLTVDLKSVALNAVPTPLPLVEFSHTTPLVWISTVKTIHGNPGTDNISVDVKTTTGGTRLQGQELVLPTSYSPTGNRTEVLTLDLPLTVM